MHLQCLGTNRVTDPAAYKSYLLMIRVLIITDLKETMSSSSSCIIHDLQSSHEMMMMMMRKRKRGCSSERVFRFKSFGENGDPTELNGTSFKENVEALVEFGTTEICVCDDHEHVTTSTLMSCWSFQLEVQRQPPFHVLLFVVEEEEEVESSMSSGVMQCTHCLYVGWRQENICKKKYHFVLPKELVADHHDDHQEKTLTSNCYSKSSLVDDFDDGRHILHGVFHSNGVGHLLAVNGFESGSLLSGHQIMDFWDRLCTALQARKVSLNDGSKKQGMELRLLHGVAYGQPWFGRWGYQFGRGCYGVTQEIYQKALQALQAIPLCLFTNHIEIPNDGINVPVIFSKYQTLSHNSLVTIGDLFHFMLVLKSRVPREATPNFDSFTPAILGDSINTCRWSSKRVEAATRVIVETLKMAECRWVSRQEVRDVARSYIGDTGLLDFVLKSLGNHIVGSYLVRRCLNPVTKVLEYRLENIDPGLILDDKVTVMNKSRVKSKYNITRAQVTKDLLYLYKQILVKDSILIPDTCFYSTIILDSRYLVKVYTKEVPVVKVPKSSVDGSSSTCGAEVERQMLQGCGCGCGRVVDCVCGCREDDGERLISCDICEVWQHTRCVHISNDQQIPHIFLCNKCEQKILLSPSLP